MHYASLFPAFLCVVLLLLVGFCCSCAVDYSCAWDFAIPGRWNAPARGILHFPSGGLLPRVRFRDSRAVDDSRAWDSAFPARWTVTARGILRFLGGGRLPSVRFHCSLGVDY